MLVANFQLKPTFEYDTVPKLAQHAFLRAKVQNNSTYPLLAGPANVFLDQSYVTETTLPSTSPKEEFSCSLGQCLCGGGGRDRRERGGGREGVWLRGKGGGGRAWLTKCLRTVSLHWLTCGLGLLVCKTAESCNLSLPVYQQYTNISGGGIQGGAMIIILPP